MKGWDGQQLATHSQPCTEVVQKHEQTDCIATENLHKAQKKNTCLRISKSCHSNFMLCTALALLSASMHNTKLSFLPFDPRHD